MTQLRNRAAFAAAIQSVRGVATAPTPASDGVLPFLDDEIPPPEPLQVVYDGALGRSGLNDGQRISTTPNGFTSAIPFRFFMRGRGVTYSASVRPPREVDLMLRACGYTATYSAVPTPQWTYAPWSGAAYDNEILTLDMWTVGRRYRYTDVVGDLSFEADGAGPIVANPQLMGLPLTPVTEALPAVGYDVPTAVPPVAAGATFAIGAYVLPNVRSVTYTSNVDRGEGRVRQNAAGAHLGWVLGRRDQRLTLVVEETALVGTPFHDVTGFNADRLYRDAIVPAGGVSVTYGATQFNRFTVAFTSAQLVEPPQYGNDAGMATVTLVFGCRESSETIVFN